MKSILAILFTSFVFNVLAEDIDSGAAGGSANVLKIDSNDFEQRDFILDGGTFLVGPGAAEYVKEGVSITVSAGSAVSLDTVKKPAFSPNAFVFKYDAKSSDWASRGNYSRELFVDSIEEFVSLNNPLAPDGTSLSQKDVYVGGWFYVTDREAGEWVFWGIYDDNMQFSIDGGKVFQTSGWQNSQEKTISLAAGWNKFEIRCYDNTGDWGKSGGILKAKSPAMSELRLFHEKNFIMKKVAVPVDLTIKDSAKVSVASDEYEFGSIEFEEGAELSFQTNCCLSASVGISGFGSVAVAENCSLDLRNANFSENMELTLKGAGTTVLCGNLPSVLKAEDGQIVLLPYVAYDTSKVLIGENVKVKVALGSVFYDAEAVAVDGGLKKYVPLSDEFVPYSVNASWTSDNTLVLCGEDVVLNIDATDFPMPKKIIAQFGATLKVTASVALPEIELADDAGFIVAAKEVAMHNGFAAQGGINRLPSFAIAADAELSVPGGMKFGGVDMLINGTLSAAGDLVLGYSAAEKNCLFDLTVDGGTIRANSGVLKFLCPDGTITVPDNTITFKSAVFESGVSGVYLKPQFCDTLPIEQTIRFDCDNTWIDFATGSYILRGSTEFYFKNGGGITKSNTAVGNRAALWIAEKVKISMLGGASFFYGEAQAGDSVGGSALGFQPDDEDFESFSISGGEIKWHRTGSNGAHGQYEGRNVGGNGKAKIFVDGTIFRTVHGTWSRGQIFENFKEVKLGEGGVVVINDSNAEALNIAAPLTGSGGVSVTNNKSALFRLTVKKNHFNTATGAFTIGENVRLILEEGANWQGTFPWSDQVEIYGFQTEQPFNMTFGGLNLSKPLVYRIWKNGNDKINFVGEGIISNGNEVQILLMDGYEPLPGTVFDLGSVSEDFDITSVINKNDKWGFRVDETDAGRHLVVVVNELDESKLVFNGGAEGSVVDLRDTAGWLGGVVPSGQDVTVDRVDLELNYEVPAFSSVTLKNGAKITVSTDNSLPLLKLSSGAELVVKEGAVLNLSAVPSVLFEESDDFSLPVIKVESGAVLTLPNTSIFRGVKMDIQGTLKVLNKGDLTFGYAQAGEIIPFGLAINGGSVLVAEGNINFACPAEGGTVVAAGGLPWTVSDATLTPGSAYGFNFGKNNDNTRMIDVVFNNTRLSYSATGIYYIQGAMSVFLKNGSVLHKGANTGYAESMLHVDNNSRLVFENAELYWSAGAHGGSVGSGALYLNPIEDGWCSLEIKDSSFFYHHLMSNRKAAIKIDNSVYNCDYSTYNYLMPFHGKNVGHDEGAYNPAYVELEGDLKFHLRKNNMKLVVPDNVSFRGKGGIEVSNPGEGYFVSTLAICNGQNTATGAIFAGEGCKVYFRDGANWAGTVVANGNMELVSSTSNYTHDTPVSVSFAKLDLQADFPVKVWKGEDGKISGNDTLNVGEYLNNGGALTPTLADGSDFVVGDRFVLGKISKASALPKLPRGWRAIRSSIPDDAENDMLTLARSLGFMIIVK